MLKDSIIFCIVILAIPLAAFIFVFILALLAGVS